MSPHIQEIMLDIPLEACTPLLEGGVHSRTARKLVGDATSFCCFVAKVNFRFEQEIYASL